MRRGEHAVVVAEGEDGGVLDVNGLAAGHVGHGADFNDVVSGDDVEHVDEMDAEPGQVPAAADALLEEPGVGGAGAALELLNVPNPGLVGNVMGRDAIERAQTALVANDAGGVADGGLLASGEGEH